MRMQKLGLSALALSCFLMSSCNMGNSNTNSIVYENTVDNYVPWMNEITPNIMAIGNAHSGNYVYRLNASNQYTTLFNQTLKQISKSKIKKITYSANVIRENNTVDCKLVIDVRDKTDKVLKWEGKDTKEVKDLKDKEWTKITMELDLTKDNLNDPDNHVRIYTLNAAKADVLVDDISIAFEVE